MKKTLINEILGPLEVVFDNLTSPEDIAHLKLALNKVRSDLNNLFSDLFDPEDLTFEIMQGDHDESSFEYYDEAAELDDDHGWTGLPIFGAANNADKNCPECGGKGKIAVPFGEDDIEYEICSCVY